MSESEDDQGGAGRREVAYRLFAAEFEDADFSYSESDEERAPNYVVTPSGARVNRLFVVGVLTEVEQVNDDVLRARIVDPTGAFVAYAGQYQPDEMAFLERTDPPTFVALTGKARTFQPEDADTVYTSVRPESINEVSAETRDRWVVGAAEQTLHRVATMAGALDREERGDDLRAALEAGDVDEGLAAGVAMALEHYGTTPAYLAALRETALDAARVVAGDVDEVSDLTVAPSDEGATTLADVRAFESPVGELSVDASAASETGDAATAATSDATAGTDAATTEPDADAGEPAASDATAEPTDDASTAGATDSGQADDGPAETETTEPVSTTESTVTTDTADTAGATDDDIGDFESGGLDGDGADDAAESGEAEDPEEFELEDDERERIEEEYGTDFSTGTEVDDPGEADIDTPDPEDLAEQEAAAGGESATEPGTAAEPEPEPEATAADTDGTAEAETAAEPEAADEPADDDADEPADAADEPADAEDIALEDAVMEAMHEHDDGDGAARDEVVAAVVDRTGAGADEVAAAIQDALMDGRCYEPDEETLKPI